MEALFDITNLQKSTETPVEISPSHKEGRKCQARVAAIVDVVHRNLTTGEDPSNEIPISEVEIMHNVAADTFKNHSKFCRRHCYAALLGGQCVFAATVSETVEELAEVMVGEVGEDTIVIGFQRYTTSILQTHGRVLSTGLLDRPTPVATIVMNGTRSTFQEHVANSRLGKNAGIEYQASLL